MKGSLIRFLTQPVSSRVFWTVVLTAGFLGGVVSALIPAKYTAESVILVDLSGEGPELLGAQLSDLLPSDFGIHLGGSSANGYSYMEIAKSRAVLADVLSQPVHPGSRDTYFEYFAPKDGNPRERNEKALASVRKAIGIHYDGRTGVLRISVRSKDPYVSAGMANEIVTKLRQFNTEIRITKASDAATFVLARLNEAKTGLTAAENRLAAFRAANARIGNAPELELARQRLERDVATQTELYALLMRQLEMAQIQEKREAPVFTLVDAAQPPVEREGFPIPVAILASVLVSATFLGLVQAGLVLRQAPLTG